MSGTPGQGSVRHCVLSPRVHGGISLVWVGWLVLFFTFIVALTSLKSLRCLACELSPDPQGLSTIPGT